MAADLEPAQRAAAERPRSVSVSTVGDGDRASRAVPEWSAQAAVDNSPRVAQLMGLEEAANRGPAVRDTLAAQRRLDPATDASAPPVAQAKLTIGGREIHKKTLFSGSAFKARLTARIDRAAAERPLTRDEIRNQLIAMIADGEHDFDDTEQAVDTAADLAFDKLFGGETPSLIFGLNGKDLEQIESAITLGYRNFDCAESYGNTALLAEAIAESGEDREDFEVNYKFDVEDGESAEDLEERLRAVAGQFGGHLDDLIIHNLDVAPERITEVWQVLHALEQEGVTTNIGVGNVRAENAELLTDLEAIAPINVIENSADSLLSNPVVAKLVQDTGAHVYLYDIVNTAQAIGINSDAGIRALIAVLSQEHPDSTAILSSGSQQRQRSNLRSYGDGEKLKELDLEDYSEGGELESAGKINQWRNAQVCEENDEDFEIDGGVQAWLQGILGDAGEGVRDQIADSAQDGDVVDADFILDWLAQNGGPAGGDLDIAVPARTDLKKRYLGTTLRTVLTKLFGTSNCDWKWSLQLAGLLSCTAQEWDDGFKFGADEIVG